MKHTAIALILEEDGWSFKGGKMEVRTLREHGKTMRMGMVT